MKKDPVHILKDKIKDIKIAMLTTIDEHGELRSRPMTTHTIENDGIIWFFTNDFSPKVNEIKQHQNVALSYSDPDDDIYVSISGTAELVRDHKKMAELWNPILKAWFPEGLNDPDLALMKISITQAEYWDAPGNKMVQLFGMAKAIMAGEEYEQGSNEKFKF